MKSILPTTASATERDSHSAAQLADQNPCVQSIPLMSPISALSLQPSSFSPRPTHPFAPDLSASRRPVSKVSWGEASAVSERAPLIPARDNEEPTPTKDALKRTYLECLSKVGTRSETLRHAMVSLLKLQVPWQQLLRWAAAAGHRGRTVTKLLSQILLDLGVRRRQPGAGPKPPPEAFLIEADVRQRYGQLTLKYLRAACRVAKARDEGDYTNSRTA